MDSLMIYSELSASLWFCCSQAPVEAVFLALLAKTLVQMAPKEVSSVNMEASLAMLCLHSCYLNGALMGFSSLFF